MRGDLGTIKLAFDTPNDRRKAAEFVAALVREGVVFSAIEGDLTLVG